MFSHFPDPGRRIRGILAFAGLALILCWVPLLTGLRFAAQGDEAIFHLPNIRRFADHFPTLAEMRNTDLSMLPLFHGVVGFMSRGIGTGEPALRAIMLAIGTAILLMFAATARAVGGGRLRATYALAAFPYFGATWFTVMTDFPALLFFGLSVLAQIRYVQTRRAGFLWAALAGSLGACLVRQNLAYIAPAFAALILASDLFTRPPGKSRLFRPWAAFGLALPISGLAFQLWLWHGLVPPMYQVKAGYHIVDARLWFLSIISVAANLGYYVMPAVAVLAWTRRSHVSRRIWVILGAIATLGTTFAYFSRGPDLVDTYGTFSHALLFLRTHGGLAPAMLVLALSLFSFAWSAHAAVSALYKHRDPETLLLAGLLFAGLIVLSFGLLRIYERHILPLDALLILLLLRSTRETPARYMNLAWSSLVLFGVAHEVLYATTVYF